MHATIGGQVATARKNRSQQDVAEKAEVTQAQLSSVERGKTTVSRDVAERIFKEVGLRHSAKMADLFQALKAFSKAHRRS